MEQLARLRSWALDHPILAIVVVWLAITLPGMGSGFLWDNDETYYAGSALNMLLTGDWIVPAIGDKVFLDKPPLAYWSMAVGMKAFGVSEFAARLPSALWALLTLLVTYALGAWKAGRGMGLLAAAVLGTTMLFGVMGRMVLVDGPLVFGMAVGLWAFWRMESAGERPTAWAGWCVLGGVGVGAAVMAKGPLGLLPGVIALVYLAIRRDFSFLRRAHWRLALGLLAIVLVAGPWYLAIARLETEQFVDRFLLEHNLARFTTPINSHEGPFFYYLPVLLLGMIPWSFFLVAAPWSRRPRDAFDLFLACWVGVPLVMFSIMTTKLPHYIAPAFPALALLTAREVAWFVAHPECRPRIVSAGFWFMAIVGLAVVGAGVAARVLVEDLAWWAVMLPGVVLVAGFGLAGWWMRDRRPCEPACALAAFTTALFFLVMMTITMPRVAGVQVVTVATLDAMELAALDDGAVGNDELFTYSHFEPSLFFYSQGHMNNGKRQELAAFLEGVAPGRRALVLVREKHLDELGRLLPGEWVVAIRAYDSLVLRSESLEARFRKKDRYRIRLVELVRPVADQD